MGHRKRGHDCFNDSFRFLKNLIIPEAENVKTGGFKCLCSGVVLDKSF